MMTVPTRAMRRSRFSRRILLVIALAVAAVGCDKSEFIEHDDQALREHQECIDRKPVKAPSGWYRNQNITLDYRRLVPEPDPRRGVDMTYVARTYNKPERLEQLYYDATHGNQRAALFVCLGEASTRSFGRDAARYLASPACVAGGHCLVELQKLKFSAQTGSGNRLRHTFTTAFQKQARIEQVHQDLVVNVLALFAVGTDMQ